MIDIGVDQREIRELEKALIGTSRKLPRELNTIVNNTARKTKTAMSREVRKELAAPAKVVNKHLRIKTKATPTNLTAVVELKESSRIALKHFKARQVGAGVSFKTSKTAGRKTIPGAFMGPRPGAISVKLRGHVFQRIGKGRLPIRKLHGPSPWGVFVVQGLRAKIKSDANAELIKQTRRRVNFLVLKANGKI